MAFIFDSPDAISNAYGSQFSKLHTLPINVVISEEHRLNQRVTDKPVEGGATISDNILLLPTTVKVSCILAGNFAKDITLEDQFLALLNLRKEREPFTITTSLGSYDSMFFSGDIVINRSASNIRAIMFDTTLKQVNIIESITSTVPPQAVAQSNDAKGAASRVAGVDSGKKTAPESTTAARDKSWIAGLMG